MDILQGWSPIWRGVKTSDWLLRRKYRRVVAFRLSNMPVFAVCHGEKEWCRWCPASHAYCRRRMATSQGLAYERSSERLGVDSEEKLQRMVSYIGERWVERLFSIPMTTAIANNTMQSTVKTGFLIIPVT